MRASVFVLCLVTAGLAFAKDDDQNNSNLLGVWQSDCVRGRHWEISRIDLVRFESDSISLSSVYYHGSLCDDRIVQVSTSGVYQTGDDASSQTEVEGATEIDVTFEQSSVIYFDQNVVDDINESARCDVHVLVNRRMPLSDCTTLFADRHVGDVLKTIFSATSYSLKMGYRDFISGTCRDRFGRDSCLTDHDFFNVGSSFD